MAAACRPRLEPVVALPLVPVAPDSALAWARATGPARPAAIRFRWRYEDERVRYAGRGTVRIAPPDSLRLDYAGPLGLGAGAGVVVGDSVAWAEPEGDFRTLVPAIPLLWAAVGTVRPLEAAAVFGRTLRGVDSTLWLWRFVRDADTLDYALVENPGQRRALDAEWRRGGRVVARSWTRYEGGTLAGARIDFPEGPARFELTVVAIDSTAVFPPELWRGRR